MVIPVEFLKDGYILSKDYSEYGYTDGTRVTPDMVDTLKSNGLKSVIVREISPYEHILNDCLRLIDKDQALLRIHNLLKCQSLKSDFEYAASTLTIDLIEDILNTKSSGESIKCINAYDDTTYTHSLRVCILSIITGMHMKLPDFDLHELGTAAALHDLGKLCVDKAILNKPSNLSNEDWSVMKMHPIWGAQLADVSPRVKKAIRYHHERLNGCGYPEGLRGKAIPLFARIIAVTDVYDALTSVRPYRTPWSPADVIEYLENNTGDVFDKHVVSHFKEAMTIFPEGTLVLLSDNTYGVVIQHNARDLKSPTVRTQSGETVNLSTDDRYIVCAAIDY